jgi:CDP-diglyceride synthetase
MIIAFKKLCNRSFVIRVITAAVLGGLFWVFFALFPARIFSVVLGAVLLLILLIEWPLLFDVRSWAFWLILPLYPLLPFYLLILLNEDPIYRPLLVVSWSAVAVFDIASFLIGKLFGHHKITPVISPGKTWEGFVGGFLTTLLFCIGFAWFEDRSFKSEQLIFVIVLCFLALAGDLFQSVLKRRAGIKDTGIVLPGHGGFLDRFDGLLFVVVFVYCFKDLLIEWFRL